MTESSANLSMPYLQPSQAQKHVTHNEALGILDALVQLAVLDRDLATPPASPAEGDRYIVAATATGAWAGMEDRVAVWDGGGWLFLAPQPGWRSYVLDESSMVSWLGSGWVIDAGLPGSVSLLGINATADASNRLVVSAASTLLSHEGAGHQLKINKAAAGDTGSLLYQTGWSGRAEMGLAGSDAFSVKVSADGSAWTVALSFDGATGLASGAAVQASASDATAGRLMTVGAFGLGDSGSAVAAPSDDADSCTTSGFYSFTASGANCPVGDPSGGSLMVLRGGASSPRQVFLSEDGQQMWCRGYAASSWSPWRAVFTQASVVGTVSQSAGVPTGAVLESGSNANGEYTRWADGTQICTNGGAAITTDPASFAGTPVSIDGAKLKIGRWY
ncbi:MULTISPECIES: DUF2793 domain-containing protein [Pseudooceanicola]|uniref:DUF2793 domain-containing protein n=1 Tax=Pseudooceanicola TaxID=1679449 RepID=UPI001EEFC706|nr:MULTISPECIES: DUF2793 domain-containing protein [Pseudooceanicola]